MYRPERESTPSADKRCCERSCRRAVVFDLRRQIPSDFGRFTIPFTMHLQVNGDGVLHCNWRANAAATVPTPADVPVSLESKLPFECLARRHLTCPQLAAAWLTVTERWRKVVFDRLLLYVPLWDKMRSNTKVLDRIVYLKKIKLIAVRRQRSGAAEAFVADNGHRIRCKLARQTCTDDAVRIVHVVGNLVPVPVRLQMAHHMKPPCRIEGPL